MALTDHCPAVCIHLHGPFRLEAGDGRDLTPRSAKACALVALLALSPRGKRARLWLQDKLWSDRGHEQGAASLRQALSQIRRDLQGCAGVLITTRTHVALDPDRARPAPAYPGGGDLLEGIDIRDPEFEAWLRSERMARQGPVPAGGGEADDPGPARPAPGIGTAAPSAIPAPGPALIGAHGSPRPPRPVHLVATTAAGASPGRLFEDLFLDGLERNLDEVLAADLFRHPPEAASADRVTISVQAFGGGDQDLGLRVQVEEGPRRRALWSGRRSAPGRGAPPVDHAAILSLIHEATEAVADGLLGQAMRRNDRMDAAILGRLAVRRIFTMNAEEIAAADRLLEEAFGLDPRAVFLAWQVQLRVIRRMERLAADDDADTAEVRALIGQALRLEPGNSMVLAAAANALVLIEGDTASGAELARRSLDRNPANPFAWDCLSIACLMEGRAKEAHALQQRACAIAARSPIRHFWDMGLCLTSVVTGQHRQALQHAQAASILAPDFRPPLRYVAALSAQSDPERAFRAIERLKALEPDFSAERMADDSDYPVAALRRSGLLRAGPLRDLGG